MVDETVSDVTSDANASMIISEALGWIGTPYRHQASCKNAGCDCLGLIRGVYAAFWPEPEQPPAYNPNWAEANSEETLANAAKKYLLPVALDARAPSNILLFRYKRGFPAKHAGIQIDETHFLHAQDGAGGSACFSVGMVDETSISCLRVPAASHCLSNWNRNEMTTLVLKTVGSVVGGALFGPLGAMIGGALGAVGGYQLDQTLFGSSRSVEGPSLSDLSVQTSTEGAAIPRLYGRARLTGQIIWATNLVEEVTSRKYKTGASKGGGASSTTETTYSYYANFAVGLCEGEIAYVGRVWANGSMLDLNDITYRVYRGTDDQLPDSLIEAKQGAENAPAYRGLAYVVFEKLPLEDFGNRIPQLSFEVVRPIGPLENQIQSVVMIPGSTEFGYDTIEILRQDSEGEWSSENRHTYEPGTDFEVSLDHLIALCPNLSNIALVVAWFGTDLRAGACAIQPRIDNSDKATSGDQWSVSGLARAEAQSVSVIEGRAAYGGTPSDASVIRAIKAIKERGLNVTLYPFIMMDIAPDNGLPDPYGAAEQAPFPWRGRITCYPGASAE